jgi:hypothetical protein
VWQESLGLAGPPERLRTGLVQAGVNWRLNITTHDSMQIVSCKILLLCSTYSNGSGGRKLEAGGWERQKDKGLRRHLTGKDQKNVRMVLEAGN